METANTSAQPPKPPRKRRRIPLWARIAIGVVVATLALVAAGVALRYWITSDGGRGFIVSQIDGRKIGPLGTIRISGLKGDPLTAATLADIALVDDDGIWLRAKDARIEWTPEKLFGGELEIHAIQIHSVDVLRTPHTTPDNDKNPPPDIGIKLDSVVIDELHLAETLVKPNAAYRIAGGAARGRNGDGFAKLSVTPISGPADRIDITSEWSPDSLKGHAIIGGPAGGLVALLAQSPEGEAVMLEGTVDGNLRNFQGGLHLAFDGEPIADVSVLRDGDAAKLDAAIAAAKWPLLDVIASRGGGDLKVSAETNLARMSNAPLSLRVTAPAGDVAVAGAANFETFALIGAPKVTATGLDLGRLAAPLTGKVDVSGDLQVKAPLDFELKGNATATDITWPSGAAGRVATPITVGKSGMSIYWEAPGAIIEGGRITPLGSLKPARYTASARGEVNLRSHVVELTQAQVRGEPGDASARGTFQI
ncbi:MAG TPA: hypothetical protein VG942_10345, partial [Hyphomonadaceae bacterium]|nr:hypothetical protein [Hyphomonadaceae bacterium]